MISRRALLLSPVAAYLPALPESALQPLNLAHWPFALPAGDMVFMCPPAMSVFELARQMESWFKNKAIIPDVAGNKVHVYFTPPESVDLSL